MRPALWSKSTTTPSAPAVATRLSPPGAASMDRMPPCICMLVRAENIISHLRVLERQSHDSPELALTPLWRRGRSAWMLRDFLHGNEVFDVVQEVTGILSWAQRSFSKGRAGMAAHLGGLVQGVATEEAEVLDIVHGRQALGHDALLAALGQHLALLCHVLPYLLRDARLRLHMVETGCCGQCHRRWHVRTWSTGEQNMRVLGQRRMFTPTAARNFSAGALHGM